MKKIQQAVHSFYQDREGQDEEITFDECFPTTDPVPVVWLGRAMAAGLAAVMLVSVIIAYGALRETPPSPSLAMQQALQVELLSNSMLGLSNPQARQMKKLLSQSPQPVLSDMESDLAQARGALFRIMAGSTDLALDSEQTRILAGLMSQWQPQMTDGRIVAGHAMDTAGLEQFLASCSEYCHQDVPDNLMQDYLTDCVMKSFAIPCSRLQTGYRNAGFESIP